MTLEASEESGIDPDAVLSASLSDVGQVRQANEDSCGEFRHPSGARLFVVADGMGGHRGGATASQTAVASLGETFQRAPLAPPGSLEVSVRTANRTIYDLSLENEELRGMGTTIVCMLILPDASCWVAHVGDSRAYLLRDGELEQLTEDHSVVAEMVRRGMLMAEEAEYHPRRNEILRSVGIEPDVEVDMQAVEPQLGDRFLLCSDGLTGLVSDYEIETIMNSYPPETAVEELVAMANSRGGTDNITVQIAALGDLEPPAASGLGLLQGALEIPTPLRWLIAALVALLLAILWIIPR